MGTKNPGWFALIDKSPALWGYLALALYMLLNNSINASSVWIEHSRDPANTLLWWEPWLWEFSSLLSTLSLCPLLFWFFRHYPPRFSALRQQLLAHALASLLFSLSHIGLMVLLRELVYHWQDMGYDFGPLARELWYEYRKDVWGYLFLLTSHQLLGFVWRRLKGDARLIAEQADKIDTTEATAVAPKHFLVRKLDKEFLVKVADIDWLEANGNYVNLHSAGRIYPLRATLVQLCSQLEAQGFSRIHRSLAVNHQAIRSISYEASGDGEIELNTGQRLALSRRYKEQLRNQFRQGEPI
ncbi:MULTISPECIES: LytR/AlgR family response regulator transcription factor [Rheinheimera]|uniref:LytR/AlgR family response regulator transcription factor n=1 Tax=Rheinheimera marina TaxID=1774958 RepID=A0ABV9JHM8_9GAMM